ncbi:MAG: sulfatase-like hydrolase/transferase, partial [Draconibacterium sp.]|nr:sulfatase-like hydrolase/transferase [Draconibacterium sp.]
MKQAYRLVTQYIVIFFLFLSFACSQEKQAGKQEVEKPNILLILMDDLGWSSLSCLGNPYVKTPNIDKLAENGVLFTEAYATPQCTPTRASLLTGQHTARNKMWHVVPFYGFPNAKMKEPEYLENLPHESYTLAEVLKDNGYIMYFWTEDDVKETAKNHINRELTQDELDRIIDLMERKTDANIG